MTDKERDYIRTLKSLLADFIRDKQPEDVSYYQQVWDWLDSLTAESPDFEAEWKRYTASRKDDMRNNAVTMNVKEVALYFAKWGRKQVLTAKPSEELEEEIHRYFKELEKSDCVSNTRRLAKHFAEWQKKQDDELLAIAHLDGVQSGREAERKEMLKTAIEGNVEYSPYAGDDAHIVFSAFVEVKDYDAIPGDSIKMIILTDND